MIAFVGAGKVATALGLYFKAKGFEVLGYYSRTYEHAHAAAQKTDSIAYSDLAQLIHISRMIWITTSDDEIENVAIQIAQLITPNTEKKLFLHASGVHSTYILRAIKEKGHHTASAHPLLAFSDIETTVKKLSDTWFTLEYDENLGEESHDFFKKTGNPVLKIDGEQKVLYHAACCMISNYLVTLMESGYQVFEKAGVDKNIIKEAVVPLMESVFENIRSKESRNALTGPIKRGDKNTVSLHLQQLQKEAPENIEIYRELGKETMKMLNDFRLENILNEKEV